MSAELESVTPEQTIQQAAGLMLGSDIGALPVVSDGSLGGMITDRDIAVRAVAQGLGPETPVSEVMTAEAHSVYDDEDVEEAALLMSAAQVRRLPVLSRESDQLIGVISLADISRSDEFEATDIALDGITEPGGAHTQSTEDSQ
jgi:CBS domain-containing protein